MLEFQNGAWVNPNAIEFVHSRYTDDLSPADHCVVGGGPLRIDVRFRSGAEASYEGALAEEVLRSLGVEIPERPEARRVEKITG